MKIILSQAPLLTINVCYGFLNVVKQLFHLHYIHVDIKILNTALLETTRDR